MIADFIANEKVSDQDQADKRYQAFTVLLQMVTRPGADQSSPEEKIVVRSKVLEILVSRDPPNHYAQG